jgi:TonB family protein
MGFTLNIFRYACALTLGLLLNALLFTMLWTVTATTFESKAVVATRIGFASPRRNTETAGVHENETPRAELIYVPPVPRFELTVTTAAPNTLPPIVPTIDMRDMRSAFKDAGLSLEYAVDHAAHHESDVIAMVRIPPSYPRPARLAGIQGYVTMEVGISPEGAVIEVSVIDAAPPRMFDVAAMDAMKRWKFLPKVVNGVAVSQRAHQTIEFKIEEG